MGEGALLRLDQGRSGRRGGLPRTPRWAVEAHLENLFGEGQRDDVTDNEASTESEASGVKLLPTAGDKGLAEANAARSDWIARNGGQDRSFKSGPRERTSDSRASKTDPDASPMSWTVGSRLGYQAHYCVVDGGKARVILGVLWSPPRRSPRIARCLLLAFIQPALWSQKWYCLRPVGRIRTKRRAPRR